jgi:16S rRNA (cytosine967-C5)-methyltransferase
VDALAAALGDDDQLEDLLAADNAAPRVTLAARPGLADVAELEAAGGTRTSLSPYGVVLEGGDPSAVPAVAEGRAGVQDEGSQLVALAMADAPIQGRDTRWLDLCAGPGGKAALLAALAAQRGAHLVANERQPHRAGLVRSGVRAVPPGAVQVLAGDGTRPPWVPGTFDRVLVDAPCSGLGALRRRPESRWRRTPEDVEVLVGLQQVLLDVAIDSVRPGGVVVYATCSPVLAETTEVVEAVLGRRDDTDEVDRFQLWPHREGTDAMFAATLRRRPLA